MTLTAAVSSNSAKVTVGQVNFCDASASFCTGAHLLGAAQLTSAGTATIKFLPAGGSHSYNAAFVGTKTMAPSASATAALTVTGPFPSVTSLTSSGSAGNWTLSASVTGNDTAAAPTGTISLLNASANNAVIASQAVSGGVGPSLLSTGSFLNFVGYPAQLEGYAATGDFNGDGFLDVVGTIYHSGVSSSAGMVLLAMGRATSSRPPARFPSRTTNPLWWPILTATGFLTFLCPARSCWATGTGRSSRGRS